MSQQVFSENNNVAAAATGDAPTTATGEANYTVYNKTLGTVSGYITGSGTTTTYTVVSVAEITLQHAELSGNGTNDFRIDFTLEPGESTNFVLRSSAGGTLLLAGCEMHHTGTGARDRNADQVILSALTI